MSVAADPQRTHTREQRQAAAEDDAHVYASFYLVLRRRKVPSVAAQAITESYVDATAGGEVPPDAWTE